MRVQMLLHVVCAGELLRASREGTRDGFLGSMNLGMPRGMSGSRKGLVAVMRILEAAWVTFSGGTAFRMAPVRVVLVNVLI